MRFREAQTEMKCYIKVYMTKIHLYRFQLSIMALIQPIFSVSGNTPVENELRSISLNIVVIGSGIISELILHMLNRSFAQFVLFTVRTMQRIPPLFISAKFVKD